MSGSCNLFGRKRDCITGELGAPSLLHKDLLGLSLFNPKFNRLSANKALCLSLTDEIVKDPDALFESNASDADLKIASALELGLLEDITIRDVLELLLKKYSTPEGRYADIILKVLDFNSNYNGSETFMATLVKVPNSAHYKLLIVLNTKEELEKLLQYVFEEENARYIISHVQDNNISKNLLALYHKYGALAFNKGLFGIASINIKSTEKLGDISSFDTLKLMADIIITTLGDGNPLIIRLLNYLINSNQGNLPIEIDEGFFGNESNTIADLFLLAYRDGNINEALKILVATAISLYINESSNGVLNHIKSIIDRAIKSFLSKVNIIKMGSTRKAAYLAFRVVEDFMGDNFKCILLTSLLSLSLEYESKASRYLPKTFVAILNALDNLRLALPSMKTISDSAKKNYGEAIDSTILALKNLEDKGNNSSVTILDKLELAIDSIDILSNHILFLLSELLNATNLLAIIKNGVDFEGNRLEVNVWAKKIKYCEEVLNLALKMLNSLSGIILELPEDLRSLARLLLSALSNATSYVIIDEDGTLINGQFLEMIRLARLNLAVDLLSKVNGGLFVSLSLYVSVDFDFKSKKFKFNRHSPELVDLESLLKETLINPPLLLWSRYIDAMADSPDIINLLVNSLVEELKHDANYKVIEAREWLLDWRNRLHRAGGSESKLFELSREGRKTGNLISDRNWGDWELDFKVDSKNFDEFFFNLHKDAYSTISSMYKDPLYLIAYESWYNEWHSNHSIALVLRDSSGEAILDDLGNEKKVFVPITRYDDSYIVSSQSDSSKLVDYYNNLYDGLTKDEKDLLTEYLDFKRTELDSLLLSGSTNAFGIRAPLFGKTGIGKLSNSLVRGISSIKRSKGVSFRSKILKNSISDKEDIKFGNELDTYDESEIECSLKFVFDKALSNSLNAIQRLPVYGVRKLKNTDDISTDLVYSTLAYANMAYSYGSIAKIVDAVESVGRTLKDRKVASKKSVKDLDLDEVPGTYSRFENYVKLNVFNNYGPRDKNVALKALNKWIMKPTTMLGSFLMLGFNYQSGITNGFTGFWLLLTESISRENFHIGHFILAISTYAVYDLARNLLTSGGLLTHSLPPELLERVNKMEAFFEMMDILNENSRKFRDYRNPIYRLSNPFAAYRDLSLAHYGIIDKWMLGVTYLSCAFSTKVCYKKENGNIEYHSLFDAFTTKGSSLVLKNNPENWYVVDENLLLLLPLLKLRYKKDPDNIKVLKSLYLFDDYGNLIIEDGLLLLKSSLVPLNQTWLSNFRILVRGINNRMHGIMNRGDGGAFLSSTLGPAIASMKRYAIGLIDNRISRARYDFRNHTMRLGFFTTVMNLLIDSMFTSFSGSSKGGIISRLDKLKFSSGFYIGTPIKLLYGFIKSAYIISASPLNLGIDKYLKNRGYSKNLIANIRRFWSNELIPEVLRLAMNLVVPPDNDEEEDPWLPELSQWILEVYCKLLSDVGKVVGGVTVDDEYILTPEYIEDIVYNNKGTIPFSLKAILHYLLFRTYLENASCSITLLPNLYTEFTSLSSNIPAGVSSVALTLAILYGLCHRVSDEELDKMEEEGDENAYNKYYDGKKIYTKGEYTDWYLAVVKMLKLFPTPMKTPMVYMDPLQSEKNLSFFRKSSSGINIDPTDSNILELLLN